MSTWPFENYVSQIDWSEDAKRNAAAKKHSERRKTRLDSPDAAVRQKASGTMAPLSGNVCNLKLKKNSRLG